MYTKKVALNDSHLIKLINKKSKSLHIFPQPPITADGIKLLKKRKVNYSNNINSLNHFTVNFKKYFWFKGNYYE